jgi:predicted transcriptional regulator
MECIVSETAMKAKPLELTVAIVSAFVTKNHIPATELPALIDSIHSSIDQLGNAGAQPAAPVKEELQPAVPIKRSVTDDYIICLEDGMKFKSLKRHLRTAYDMSPEQYRAKWGLKPDYPMVAPAYAAIRSNLAKTMGLGQVRQKNAPPPAPAEPAKKSSSRSRAA